MNFKKFEKSKFSGPEEIRKVQEESLRAHLDYLRTKSPYYREVLKSFGNELSAVNPETLRRLPFTEKEDIERNPDAFLAVDKERVADIVLSSGTTGKAIQIFYTDEDLKRLAYNEKQAFEGCGIKPSDTVLLTCTMDRCFIAGLAYFLGMRELGATVIRNGHGSIESHEEIIRTMKPTVIVGVPTFLKKLGKALRTADVLPGISSVKKLICIGEPLRTSNFETLGIARDLEQIWNAKLFSTYASSETVTTFCECLQGRGGHLLPELAVVEIIDDEGNVLPEGQCGEVVVTPLAVEGMPLLRYKTGDISFLENAPCACGRFTPRLGPIMGRKKQRMKVKGTTLYPEMIFSALDGMDAVGYYYVTVFSECELSDRIVIHLSFSGRQADIEMITEKLAAKLRVKPEIIVEDDAAVKKVVFKNTSRKPVRFFDQRNTHVSVSK